MRGVGMLRSFGVEAHPISPREAQAKWPLMQIDDVVGAIWYPQDGKCNPIDTCMALAKGARVGGARIIENTKVDRILVENGRAVGVETAAGVVHTEIVVNCAGIGLASSGALLASTCRCRLASTSMWSPIRWRECTPICR